MRGLIIANINPVLYLWLVYQAKPFLALVLHTRGRVLAKVMFGMQLIKNTEMVSENSTMARLVALCQYREHLEDH